MLPVIQRDLCSDLILTRLHTTSIYSQNWFSNVDIKMGTRQVFDRQALSTFLMGKHPRVGSQSPVFR